MPNPVRVLIVDDSATIRALIRQRLLGDPRLMVVGEAVDPIEAQDKIRALNPDVLTLDVEMPRMNGIEFLKKLMRLHPMPVVMISTLTQKGAQAALEALSLGAVECIGKPAADRLPEAFVNLADILIGAARSRPMQPAQRSTPSQGFDWNGRYVLIGSSTGGVDALETLLSGFPANCPPTCITQHMPPGFLDSFAHRLDSRLAPKVMLAQERMPLKQGHVYLAPGGETHLHIGGTAQPYCKLVTGEKVSGHRPSVDAMFGSALPIASKSIAVMLTGMGRDGAEQMLALRRGGALCLAQDEASCVVYGMPRVAKELGAVEASVPITRMSEAILSRASKGRMAAR